MAVQKQMPSAQSVEQIRARARRRLIGAFVLVIIAIGIFAWLFDSNPRQTNVDIPLEIAGHDDQNDLSQGTPSDTLAHTDLSTTISPMDSSPTLPTDGLYVPEGTTPDGTMTSAVDLGQQPANGGSGVSDVPLAPGGENVQTSAVGQYGVRPARLPYLRSKYSPRMESQVAAAQRSGLTASEMRAAALLGDLPAQESNASNGAGVRKPDDSQQSFVVQVGAYAEQDKVDEVRAKLTLAGYSSFVQEVQTSAGKRIRVRVGPFEGRRAADLAAEKIKGLGFPTSVMVK